MEPKAFAAIKFILLELSFIHSAVIKSWIAPAFTLVFPDVSIVMISICKVLRT